MNIEDLLQDSFRKTADLACEFILANPAYFEKFIQLSFAGNKIMAMRSSRVVLLVYVQKPEMVKPFIPSILSQLYLTKYNSSIRNILPIFYNEADHLSEKNLGKLINLCFKLLESTFIEVAPRAISMKMLYQISNKIPDIKMELKALIEIHFEQGSAAFKCTAKKTLQKLNEEITE